MSIGTRAIGVGALGVVPALSVPTAHPIRQSGAIGTHAIGAYSIGGNSGTTSASGGVNHLIHWRRRGRR